MEYKNWDEDTKRYILAEGFEIERADSDEFAIYCSTYRNENLAFRKSWDNRYSEMKNTTNCFWINKDEQRIGGVRMSPNYIDNLFLQPPYCNINKVLRILKKILVYWSDKNKDIYTSGVMPSEVQCYKSIGFFENISLHYMIRPTEKFILNWEENIIISCPVKENHIEIAKLFHEAYSGGVDDYVKQSIEEHILQVKEFFNEELSSTVKDASILVYDKTTNELIGTCLVGLWDGWPEIFNLAIKPSYRSVGLAEKMIKRALSILKDEYPVIRLNVLVGNPAEALYDKIGFLVCSEMSYLVMPNCYK